MAHGASVAIYFDGTPSGLAAHAKSAQDSCASIYLYPAAIAELRNLIRVTPDVLPRYFLECGVPGRPNANSVVVTNGSAVCDDSYEGSVLVETYGKITIFIRFGNKPRRRGAARRLPMFAQNTVRAFIGRQSPKTQRFMCACLRPTKQQQGKRAADECSDWLAVHRFAPHPFD
jgi:hypothetical protein